MLSVHIGQSRQFTRFKVERAEGVCSGLCGVNEWPYLDLIPDDAPGGEKPTPGVLQGLQQPERVRVVRRGRR